MENTNETKSMKQKAKEFYLRNKVKILVAGGVIGVAGVGIIGKHLIDKYGEKVMSQLNDDFQKLIESQEDTGIFEYIDKDGAWMLVVSETTQDGIKSMEQIAKDILAGHYNEN